MFRPFLPVIAGVFILLTVLQPGSAAGYSIADPSFSPDQARAIFLDAGYSVNQLETWDSMTPSGVTFQVDDLTHNSLLLVQVYPDVAQAQRHSERMVEGYSASTWIDNLALFEANADEYRQADSGPSATLRVARVDTEYTQLILDAMNAPRLH